MILGARLAGLPARVVTFNVCDDRAYFVRVIGDICEQLIAGYHLHIDFDRQRDIHIVDGYVGRGYAISRPEELTLLLRRGPHRRDFSRSGLYRQSLLRHGPGAET